jgi:hypothetical protein
LSTLEQLCLFDQDFERRLNASNRLRAIFERITGPGDPILHETVQDDCAMLYIEHALLNRARFACTQKYNFVVRYDDIPYESIQNTAEIYFNSELEYLSTLLVRLETPDMLEAKSNIKHLLVCRLGGGDDDDDDDDREHHVIPLDDN